ncbi:MAG: hypothetical protein ACI9CA_002105 [Natronomonas sp.]|jgi:hypothetical protein
MAPIVRLFGPVDGVLGAEVGIGEVLVVEVLLLVLVVGNFLTRFLAHSRHRHQAEDGPEAVSRVLPHEVANVVLIVVSLYYLTLDAHAGMVMSVLVLTLFLTDFFEFEARKAEARRDVPLDRPKGALAAGVVAFAYAAYQVVFFIIDGYLAAVI